MIKLLLGVMLVLVVSGCSDNKKTKSSAPGMKCGAGKCGANMFDGKGALAKKKQNILKQMREDDPRKGCVLQAHSAKAIYDCIRDPKTKKLTKKCGVGKCGNATEQKAMPKMKCGSGKCGAM